MQNLLRERKMITYTRLEAADACQRSQKQKINNELDVQLETEIYLTPEVI